MKLKEIIKEFKNEKPIKVFDSGICFIKIIDGKVFGCKQSRYFLSSKIDDEGFFQARGFWYNTNLFVKRGN